MTEKTAVSREHVLETIREQLKGFEVDPDSVRAETSYDVLGLDSLDLVELSVKIEDEYSIDLEEEDLKEVTTIDSIIDLVLKKLDQS
ncbi:MAG: phosphopantetheine-binding protein [Actinomycetota bacterium]